jgi:hypothetical protein
MIRRVRGETGIRLRMRFQNARLAALGSEPAKLANVKKQKRQVNSLRYLRIAFGSVKKK